MSEWTKRLRGTHETSLADGTRVTAIPLQATDGLFPAGWTYVAVRPGSKRGLIPIERGRLPDLDAVLSDVQKQIAR